MNTSETMIKTTGQILKDNICTLFNLFNVLIAMALAIAGAWTNMAFILVIAVNTLIGIIQELRARKLVSELTLLSAPEACIIRDGSVVHIPAEELQIGDLLQLKSGHQVCADAILEKGQVEVNESILTGESDAVLKQPGDSLLSGSFIVSGKCSASVIHIGSDNFAESIALEAKKIKQAHSELMLSMRKVTRFTGFLIVPLGILLLAQAFFLRNAALPDAIVSASAALLGMLPKGLVLLISISLAVGVSRLAKRSVLVQDLYSLETLAHVDTICLDKTGTLTEGNMQVEETLTLGNLPDVPLSDLLGSFFHFTDDNNATFQALYQYFGENTKYPPKEKIPFSSQRKWSAMTFDALGTILIGAPELFMNRGLPAAVEEKMRSGTRVLVIGWTGCFSKDHPFQQAIPLEAVFLSDPVRANAPSTLAAFKREGVSIKIISGDHPAVVSAAAKQAGLEEYDSYIDMSTIQTEEDLLSIADRYEIFGRVTPNQKKQLVQALQANGHSVAMAGDGVNDILAMREADCSITVEGASDAARQTAKIVLLDSDFSSLLHVLREGRRVVNNITKVASVFFIKTIYSILLSLFCVFTNTAFPFIPIQITLIDMAIEGYPAFFMSFEPDNRKVTGDFFSSVLRGALPNGLTIAVMVGFLLLGAPWLGIPASQISLFVYLVLGFVGMEGVFKACMPFNKLHLFLFVSMCAGFLTALFLFHTMLYLPPLGLDQLPLAAILIVVSIAMERFLHQTINQSHSFHGIF